MMVTVGSLFSGYGGLDIAVGGTLAWYSEIDSAADRAVTALRSHILTILDTPEGHS